MPRDDRRSSGGDAGGRSRWSRTAKAIATSIGTLAALATIAAFALTLNDRGRGTAAGVPPQDAPQVSVTAAPEDEAALDPGVRRQTAPDRPIQLTSTTYVDLDSLEPNWGATTDSRGPWDLHSGNTGGLYPSPLGEIAALGAEAPREEPCASVTAYSDWADRTETAPGSQLCVVTDDGRRALLTVLERDAVRNEFAVAATVFDR